MIEITEERAEQISKILSSLKSEEAKELVSYLTRKLAEQNDDSVRQAFEKFWEMYDYKVGREVAWKAWKRIPKRYYPQIFAHVPKYVANTPDKQYRKHPRTYLHQRAWEDEVLPKAKYEEIY